MLRLRSTVLVLALAAGGAALAQYDRDGRYVPSPNGVPEDPLARPIPGYSGTPGGGTGTPIWPRGAMPPRQVIPPLRPAEPPGRPVEQLPLVRLTLEQCAEGWSRQTGIARIEFTRRCRLLQRR